MRLKNQKVVSTVDSATGEIITVTESKEFNIKTDVDTFYMTFLTPLKEYMGLNLSGVRVLAALCDEAEYNTGVVKLNPAARERICNLCSIKYQSLSNTLQYLKRKGFVSLYKGDCTINPMYFWKGDTTSRKKIMEQHKLSLTFNFIPNYNFETIPDND